MSAQTYLSQLFRRDGDSRLINRRIQIGLTTKASGRDGRADEIEHGVVTLQRVTRPVGTHQVEHAMLNKIPFRRAGGIMRDRDNQTELVSQTLQANFPEPPPTAIRTTPIGLDQQVSFTRVKKAPLFQPPRADRRDGKLGGIMRCTDENIALVMADVIDPIRDGFALSQVQKVVHIDLAPLLPPLYPGLLKVADQFTLFGINTDGWPTAAQISLSPAHNVTKLWVTVGRLFARHSFVIDPQRISSCLQQTTNRRGADGILRGQGFLNFAQRFVRPLQTRDGVTGRFLGQQRFQGRQQPWRFFSTRGRPPPLTLIRALKSLAAISC